MSAPDARTAARLDAWYDHVEAVFLSRQRPNTGLLPASTAKTVHGDYAHAWVRDNVYSILSAWALSLAYRRHDPNSERLARLQDSTIRVMRGLLAAMMGQADKVERFKRTEDPLDALHAKYDADTGAPVVGDDGWGHLQLDATSLFLLQLAQMTAGGLDIVRSQDEADFVQNLVHYVGPAYRTGDYGIWERGAKQNTGDVEINASSVGLAKAALEAMSGLDLFKRKGRAGGVIHVMPDEVARARETLHALLPQESASKETDAALLAVVGWPAYAVEDEALAQAARARVIERLLGRYGCKRFLRDGHQTEIEDHGRLHYERGELGAFEHIESEWPLFLTYLQIEAGLRGDLIGEADCAKRLAPLFVERDGVRLLPELYKVPKHAIAAEAASPGSQDRVANDNLPLFWAQSLYIVAELLREGLILPADLDPLKRRERMGRPSRRLVGVAILASDDAAQAGLAALGLNADRLDEAELDSPRVEPSHRLADLLSAQGANAALGLSGRPKRRLGALSSCRVYSVDGRLTLFLSAAHDAEGGYSRFDAAASAHRIRSEIAYVARHWTAPYPPVMTLPVSARDLQGPGADAWRSLLADIAAGQVGEAAVFCAPLPELVRRARLFRLSAAALAEPVEGEAASCFVDPATDAAARRGDWRSARRLSGESGYCDERLQDGLKEIVVRLRDVVLDPWAGPNGRLHRPLANAQLYAHIKTTMGGDPLRTALATETLLHLGGVIKAEPAVFDGCRTVRLGDWTRLLFEPETLDLPADPEAQNEAPSAVRARIAAILAETPGIRRILSDSALGTAALSVDWTTWRVRLGVITRVNEDFFQRVWRLLARCETLVIGNPAAPGARLDAAHVRSDFTPRERNFATLIDDRLTAIPSPAYRTATLEALNAAATVCEADPSWRVAGELSLDALIHDAVRAGTGADGPEAWRAFFAAAPSDTAISLRQAALRDKAVTSTG